jgi:hypothetical protein
MNPRQSSFATKDSFDAFIDFNALKRHFTTDSYDYQKYGGKVKAKFDAFVTRPDVHFFHKISKHANGHELMLANIISNPKVWISELCNSEAERIYREWKGRQEALSYQFGEHLKQLGDDFSENFLVKNGQHPTLIVLFLKKKISMETLSILIQLTKVAPEWKKQLEYDAVAQNILRVAEKYAPFIEYDKKKFAMMVREYFEKNE